MPTRRPLSAAERRGDGEDGAVDRVDVDAHLLRRLAILRGRAHREAELGEAQEDEQQRRADERRRRRSAGPARRSSRRRW